MRTSWVIFEEEVAPIPNAVKPAMRGKRIYADCFILGERVTTHVHDFELQVSYEWLGEDLNVAKPSRSR